LLEGDDAEGATNLADFLAEASGLLAKERSLGELYERSLVRLSPLIAIDQGKELFATGDDSESTRLLNMLGKMLSSPHEGLDPYVLITIRADSVDALLKFVPKLGVDTPHVIALPPLSPAAYRDVITKPAEIYTRHVHRLCFEPELVQALVTDATGADALPLLAFTLLRLYANYSADEEFSLAHYEAIGGAGGSIDHSHRRSVKPAQPARTICLAD
jgi:hypothetical protein